MKYSHTRQHLLPYVWPDPPYQIALLEPEIPPNTGNIARLCAATGSPLHLIGRLGFRLNDAALKRAGLDYWDAVILQRHVGMESFLQAIAPARCFFFSTRGKKSYLDVAYQPGDVLVFGCESRGLPDALLDAHPQAILGIPIRIDHVRSLNLATAVGIVLFEALRQAQQ
ncbi:MAG: tRNA (cytidine(34)-2'-O)-methyltransferase [Verrucomicrobia bacterium]|nr:tRNA (cytidine(34)-2'-O)-methyltransferase [Verrucomicrobiota bacterium]MBU4427806.1 tRNA (cytidine(34)-2'-O)-methyltransferase [Verrucomicrobiota bacterium]MCG2681367.1 tRNA (cytidine(34)-2'-O)-methyltransferase [Kiritimatiellia bacterium]